MNLNPVTHLVAASKGVYSFLLGSYQSNIDETSKGTNVVLPRTRLSAFIVFMASVLRAMFRSLLILIIFHVLFIWPSGAKIFSTDTMSFKDWVSNISMIPAPMWGIISSIILAVAAQEVVLSIRKRRTDKENIVETKNGPVDMSEEE